MNVLQMHVYKIFGGHMFLFILDEHPTVEMLGHVVRVYLTF